jgi:hypothetical protein
MDFTVTYVSDQWLRTYAYERAKEGQDAELSSAQHGGLRLAEARATLRTGPRQWRTDPPDPESVS